MNIIATGDTGTLATGNGILVTGGNVLSTSGIQTTPPSGNIAFVHSVKPSFEMTSWAE